MDPLVARVSPYYVEDLQEGRTYQWCACGRSKSQPFCDGSHRGTGIEPLAFEKETVKNVVLCGCKRTKRPPYCDGQHRLLMAEDEIEREERFPRGLPIRDEHSRDVKVAPCVPDLPVEDCPNAIRHYCEVLGFEKAFDDAELGFDRTLFAGVKRDGLMLTLDWHRRAEIDHKVQVSAVVDDVDALFEELSGRGAKISSGLTEHAWGDRSFTVEDLDGHQLTFSMPVKSK